MSDEIFIGTPCKYKRPYCVPDEAILLHTDDVYGDCSLLYVRDTETNHGFFVITGRPDDDGVYYESADGTHVLVKYKESLQKVATALFNINDPTLEE